MIAYADIIKRSNGIIADGYSNAKTVNGALADFGRYIAKHVNENDGNMIVEYRQEMLCAPSNDYDYFLSIEYVGCASRLNENDEMEYKEGYNYYLCCRTKQ